MRICENKHKIGTLEQGQAVSNVLSQTHYPTEIGLLPRHAHPQTYATIPTSKCSNNDTQIQM